MISFLLCLALLIVGYFVYGKIVDNTFGPDDRETPAVRINDGVDYVVMPQWKLFLVQLLNIAGLGPIFGALQGALWGPVVFLWITFGTIFAGGVHDYFSGMMSERNEGASIAEVTGKYLGPVMQNIMRVFSVVLLIMVGTVFAVGPAGLIVTLCKNSGMSGVLTTTLFWLIIILVYYFIATFISIDAIIGKIYPVFGICLIIMAVGGIVGIFTNPAYTIPELWDHFGSMHPSGTPIWSFMFITVACGAISGFHSTQSPLMARCMKSEKQGHFVFYGAMVCEGIIALIWAAAGCSLYEVTGGLNTGLAAALAEGQSAAIYDVCSKTMGGIGIALAMIGVVICPITSGDTAFRSARRSLADWRKIDQDSYANRLKLCIPVLGVGAFLGIGNALGFIDYTVIWRYFSWTNQTLAMIVLWAASMYLFKEKKNYWITAVPATFMSAVYCTYFVLAPECLGGLLNSKTAEGATIYNTAVAYPVGIVFAVAMLALFIHATKKHTEKKAASPIQGGITPCDLKTGRCPHQRPVLLLAKSGKDSCILRKTVGQWVQTKRKRGIHYAVQTCTTGSGKTRRCRAGSRQKSLQKDRPLRRRQKGAVPQQLLHRPLLLSALRQHHPRVQAGRHEPGRLYRQRDVRLHGLSGGGVRRRQAEAVQLQG